MTSRPDAAQSRAVLIGAGDYESVYLPTIPQTGANLGSLQELLADREVWGLRKEHFVVSPNPRIVFQDVRQLITEAAREARDTLLVYFTGHGLIHNRELYLAISSTVTNFVDETAVRWADVKNDLAKARAHTKIVILDCCFAERAVMDGVVATLSGSAALRAQQDAVTYVLCATSMTEAGVTGDGPRTPLTDELCTVLQHGILNGPEQLTLRSVYEEVHSRLTQSGQPAPRLHSHPDPAADTVLFRSNPRWSGPSLTTPGPQVGLKVSDVIGWLTEEQRALIDARPGYRPARGSGPETPQLTIAINSVDEASGRFDVLVTGADDRSVLVTLLAAQIEHARNVARAAVDDASGEQPDGADGLFLEAEENVAPLRPATPLLDLLAAALAHRLLRAPGALAWAPHKIGNAYPPPDEVIRPGAAVGTRPTVGTQAEKDVRELLDDGQHVLLVGAGASGKTTIARNQAWIHAATRRDGLIWLDLTDPDDGVDSVMLTLLGLPLHPRYLLVVDNLQAQPPDHDGRHPVLDLLAGLKDELGLRVATLVTGWPRIEDRLDYQKYGLERVYTRSLQVIKQLLKGLSPDAAEDIIRLAPDDIEVTQVALDFYKAKAKAPSRRQVAAHFAQSKGASGLVDTGQRRLLYWFACLCALEIDIPQHHVASWQDQDDHVAFSALRRAGLIEPADEAWSVGNSTRARLLMEFALSEWSDIDGGLESRGRIVYDHLRRLGPRHIRNTLGQLRLKFESSERGDLGNLWAECVDLTHRLEAVTHADPTWGGSLVNAAFVATALGAMRSEKTAAAYAYVHSALDLLDPPNAQGTVVELPDRAAGSEPGQLVVTDPGGTRLPAVPSDTFSQADLEKRLVLAVLLAVEAWATAKGAVPNAVPRDSSRVNRFKRLALESLRQTAGGALSPHDEPWVTSVIMSGLILLTGNPAIGAVTEAAVWLSTDHGRGGAFRNGWAAGPWTRNHTNGPDDHLDLFATAFCTRALNDAERPASLSVLTTGLDILHEALPTLRSDGAQVNRTAALAALLHCRRRWRDHVDELHELLDWTIVAAGKAAHGGQAAAEQVPWVACLLLTVVPGLVQDELEELVLQVLRMTDPPEEYPSVASDPGDEPPPVDEAQAAAAASARERFAVFRRNTDTLMHEIEDQILQRRSTLRGISDPEAQHAIGTVLDQWREYQATIELVQLRLEAGEMDSVIGLINKIGRKVFANSWQDLQ